MVLEIGLGGRLDPVNIVDSDIAILTNVELDHQDWLGEDKESKQSNIDYYLWRKKIIKKIISFKNETVIFTHFVVINNVIGKITNSKKVINFYPDNCSITEIGIENNKMELIKLGNNSISKVN